MKLYHGSNVSIETIDLKRGRKGKDFGQGFYLSADRYQLQYIQMDELIRQLSFVRPTFQFFFGTKRAIRLLHKIENDE